MASDDGVYRQSGLKCKQQWEENMVEHVFYQMMSLQRLRDIRDFSSYSSSAEWADEDKPSSSALSEADVEGPVVAESAGVTGTACLTCLKNE
ncbi:hypothetical protein E2C01_050392 [Portunus trituberculatus]|uniref:Uncharacterized protein n=1 Tax=Portunus trituberculatus TaxID=210409 RepID=A0A5B7G851_PORTR|nr:hypothetical protein [Portunus trituberculatus]